MRSKPIVPAAALALFAATALAAPPADAAKAPGGFSSDEVAAIAPLLKRYGVVAVSETDARGEPTSMTLAIRVNASREKTFEVFEDPRNFYYISTLFKENKVLQEHDNSKAFSWASRHKLFSFTGRNTIALFPPRRVDVRVVESTIGSGEFTVMLHEEDPEHTIVVVSGLLDVQTSEWLVRFLLGGNPSIRNAMNVAIGLVMTKGIKAMAERIAAGEPLDKHRTRGRAGGKQRAIPPRHLRALAPLLVRGQVILSDSRKGGRLRQATVIEVVEAPASDVVNAISTPANYSKMIKAIDSIRVHQVTPPTLEFSWSIGLSVFSLTSRNRMTRIDDGLTVDALDGELKGARWRWQVVPTSKTRTVVAYHGFANIRRSTYILEKTVRREPYLEHGLLVGSNMVMLRAIREGLEGRRL